MSGLEKKVILITGASSGIGAGTAEEFAKKGSWLSLCGRNAQSLADVAKKCHEAGVPQHKILQVVGDLSQEADTIAAVEKTVAHFGRLDVLVNSAGILTTGGLEDLSLEDYDQQMNINTRAVLHIMKLSLPHLLKTKGNIVNVSSITGIRAFPGVVAYNMSKAALDHLTRSVALEVASRGVRVNAVNPGVIVTDIHRRAGMDDEKYKAFLEHGKTTHAMGRVGEVKEVAKPIVFLASDDASFITGQMLAIDGGRGVMCPR